MLERAVRIFEAFNVNQREMGVSEIARAADLPVPTASRLIAELVRLGLLERADRKVRVGIRMWELAARAVPTLTLAEAALPVMQDLHSVIRNHLQLAVLDGSEVLYLERLSAEDSSPNYSVVASRLPLHASSAGHVLLAHAPRSVQERVMASRLVRYTDNTVTDGAVLRRMLAATRRHGYAFLAGHLHPEAAGAGVPVYDAEGTVVASLTAVLPNDDGARSVIPALLSGSRGITRRLAPGVVRDSEIPQKVFHLMKQASKADSASP